MDQQHLQALLEDIRQHRSNEANFDTLMGLLETELGSEALESEYEKSLQDVKNKQAEEYRRAKEGNASAWPEFEQFFSQFETAVLSASKRT